jgi:predicted metalloprotease with PDZ domain
MSKKIRFIADPDTRIGTGLNGKNIVVEFEDGVFETDDIALADLLMTIGVEVEDEPRKPKPVKTEEPN